MVSAGAIVTIDQGTFRNEGNRRQRGREPWSPRSTWPHAEDIFSDGGVDGPARALLDSVIAIAAKRLRGPDGSSSPGARSRGGRCSPGCRQREPLSPRCV